MTKSLTSKVDESKFDTTISDAFQAIEDLQKDVMSKANIKEVVSLLKNKTGK